MIAMVAAQAAAALMADQACIAALAQGGPATVMTQHDRGIAPPVDEQQNLMAGLQMLADACDQGVGQAVWTALTAQVDHADARWLGLAVTVIQGEMLIAPLGGVEMTFQRGCGRSQDHRNGELLRPAYGQIAGVVADPVLLLV